MIQVLNFCHGCNEKFDVSQDSRCPNCGLDLPPLDLAPTSELGDLVARETHLGTADLEDRAGAPLAGTRIANYELEHLLGRGGMASVYRAQHLMLRRPCALKVISPRLIESNPAYIELFFNEARAAASLVHPNVVTVHTIGVDDPYHYIEMEYVEGHSLQHHLDREGRVGPVRAVQLVLQVAAALAEAHSIGLVHRDLKPANVLVAADGRAKLADFGLAKTVVTESGSRALPAGQGLLGTPYYMAPELFDGAPADKRTDVYATGGTLFHLLTGRPPFLSHSLAELTTLHRTEPVPRLAEHSPEAPDGVQTLLDRCLAKSPEDRYPDAKALFDELKAIFGNLRDIESLLTEALHGVAASWQGSRGRFRVDLRLPDGRTQRVHIESSMSTPVSQRVVRIFSISAPVRRGYLMRALELNTMVPYASIGVREVGGEPHFVVVNTYPRATCDAEEIRRSVLTVGRWADRLEKRLTGEDRF